MKHKIRNLLTIIIGMLILSITTVSEARNPMLEREDIQIQGDSGYQATVKTQKATVTTETGEVLNNTVEVSDDGRSYTVYKGKLSATGAFEPFTINGSWVFCVQHHTSYEATYEDSLKENQWHRENQRYDPVISCGIQYVGANRASVPDGPNWQAYTMEYNIGNKVNIYDHQDVGYILQYGKDTDGSYNKSTTNMAIWGTNLNIGSGPESTPQVATEAAAFKRFYENTHSNGDFRSQVAINTSGARVGVNVPENAYIVGPIYINYPDGSVNGKNRFCWITDLVIGGVQANVDILFADGTRINKADLGKDGTVSLNNKPIYLKFGNTGAKTVSINVKFGYIDHFEAEIYEYNGTKYRWYYEVVEHWECNVNHPWCDSRGLGHLFTAHDHGFVHGKGTVEGDGINHYETVTEYPMQTGDTYNSRTWQTYDYQCTGCGAEFKNVSSKPTGEHERAHKQPGQSDKCMGGPNGGYAITHTYNHYTETCKICGTSAPDDTQLGVHKCRKDTQVAVPNACTHAIHNTVYIYEVHKQATGSSQKMIHVRKISWFDEKENKNREEYVREFDEEAEVSATITIPDMIISGTVFLDKDRGKANQGDNLLQEDERLSGIEVRLFNASGSQVGITLTDANGNYSFSVSDPFQKYYVQFAYNGMLYTNVTPGTGSNASHSTEEAQGHGGNRQSFNNKFAEIGSNTRTYYQEEITDLFKEVTRSIVANGGNTAIGNGDKVQFVLDCRINAYSILTYPNSDYFTISDVGFRFGNYYEPIGDKMSHVNLGIKSRPTFDLALSKDVLKAEVSINGKTETYKYDARKDRQNQGFQLGINEEDYLTRLRNQYIYGTNPGIVNTEKPINDSYNQEMRTEEIVNGNNTNSAVNESKLFDENKNYAWRNANYNLQEADKLKIIVTYKLAVRNQSGIVGAVTEIVDYYDAKYNFVRAFVGDKNGNEIAGTSVTASDTSKYGNNAQFTGAGYKAKYLRPTEQRLDTNNKEQYIYVQLELINPEQTLLDAKLPSGEKLKTQNFAEINGYKTYGEGLIDRDSKPGNFNVSTYTIGEPMEDDENLAPAYVYSISNSRTLEGTVFEDGITSIADSKTVATNKERFGNGVIDNTDKKIKDVKVELVEIKNGKMIVRQTTFTDENGWYGFGTFLPGDYVIRFTYGYTDGTAMTTTSQYRVGSNDRSYNGQDYTSTIYGKNSMEVMTNMTPASDDILTSVYQGDNAIKDSDEQILNVPTTQTLSSYANNSYYWYTDTNIANKSDAIEDSARRAQINAYAQSEYGMGIINHKAEVFNSFINNEQLRNEVAKGNINPYLQAQPMHALSSTNENISKLADELERRTYGYAYTAVIPVEVEYATKETTKNSAHKITGIDFGLVERPKALLTIDQDIAHIKVTSTDGTTIFDTSNAVKDLQWVGKGSASRYEKNEQVNVILADELLNGAQITITYEITVTNNGESGSGASRAVNVVNYVANNLVFDLNDNNDSNGKALWEAVKVSDIQKEGKKTLINNDNGANNLKQVDLSTQNVILKASATNPLVTTTLNIGDKVTTSLVVKKVLSNGATTDDLSYTNLSEIVEISNSQGRYDHGAIPGNQDINVQPREHDASGASKYIETDLITYPQDGTVVVTPPTGQTLIYYVIGIISAVILAGGVLLIKKYAVHKEK